MEATSILTRGEGRGFGKKAKDEHEKQPPTMTMSSVG